MTNEALTAEYDALAAAQSKAIHDTMYLSRNGNYSSPAYTAASKAAMALQDEMAQFEASHPAIIEAINHARTHSTSPGVLRALAGQD